MTPSTSMSIQKALRQAQSGTMSPSVGSRVLDVKTTSFGPVNPTLPNKKRKDNGCKDSGQVQAGSDHVAALVASSDKKRKGAVKKCLSPTVEAAKELEYGSGDGSSDKDYSEEERDQRSPNSKDPTSGKHKSFSRFNGRDTWRGANKKKSLPASSEPKTGTSSQKQELSGATTFDEGVDKPGRSGKKGRTLVSERMSMAKTTRGTTTLASEPVSVARTTRRAATKSKV